MSILTPVLAQVRTEPSRTWSIIITIYGDAIVPRGGSVWLGTLLAFFVALDTLDGVVRTAASRLTADGWLERRRIGRHSYYRLAPKGEGIFREAAGRIYTHHPPPWAGYFDLWLPERGVARPANVGMPVPGVWLAPGGTCLSEIEPALHLKAGGEPAANRALAARAWPIDAMAAAYDRFNAAFTPLRDALDAGATFNDLEAMVARILMIHAYRRIVLRDPRLPPDILPPGWPGTTARALCAEVYRQLLPASEHWLDLHAVDEFGAKLPANPEVLRRFLD